MKKSQYNLTDPEILHQKAEKLFQKKTNEVFHNESDEENLKLIHKLAVHQIELEMQNKELIEAYKQVDAINKSYEELFDFTPACYYKLSTEGEILSLNLSGAHILGKDPISLNNRRFSLFVSDETKPVFNQFLHNIYNTKTKQSSEVTLLPENKLPIHVYLIGLVTDNGKECHTVVVDITEKKKIEDELGLQKIEIEKQAKELLVTNKELEQSLNLNAEKNRFISILAHDLKSPFSVLLGMTEVLLESMHQIDLAEIKKIVKEINHSANNTYGLLEDMLKWARMQSDKMPFDPKKIKFVEISNQVIKILQPYALSKNITLINTVSDELFVFADKQMIDAVLRNLVSNSIKFTKQNGVIEISARQSDSNLIISVSDNGRGIASENLIKLFDNSQIQSTEGTAKEKGTGLGLLICKEFVEKHGGKIWVESVVGKGSIFYFNMPFRVELKELNTESDHYNDGQVKNLKTLIVDDQYSLRLILGEMVKIFSREILFASSGEEAIEICWNNPDLDLILMDFQMSEMNGFEATKQIKHFNKKVIIILQTAFEQPEMSKMEDYTWNDGYFTKPYNKSSLLEMIKKHFK